MKWESISKKIGDNIRLIRKEKHLSQEKLAELAEEISVRQVQNIEAGKANCTIKSLVKIGKALQTNPQEFFND